MKAPGLKELLIEIHTSTGRVLGPNLIKRINKECAFFEKKGLSEFVYNEIKSVWKVNGTYTS